MIVGPAHYHLYFALQSGVSRGANTVHAIIMLDFFPWHFLIVVDAGIGTKLAMTMATFTSIVTKQVASEIVGTDRLCKKR
jgi:hypothetical protein